MRCPRITPPLAAALVALAASTARADDVHRFAVTGGGPGQGHSAGSLGVGPLFLSNTTLLGLGLSYRYGVSDPVDFLMSADLGLNFEGGFGVFGVVDIGILARFTPRSPDFHVGAKLAPEVVFFALASDNGGGLFLFGVTPGLFIGGGSPTFQASMGIDLPLYFAGVASVNGRSSTASGFSAAIRPYGALEGALTPSIGLFLKGAVELGLSDGRGFLFANLSAGISF